MTSYRRIRDADSRSKLEQRTWAKNSLLLLAYDTVGSGAIETELIDFGLVFEQPPFFGYGVELRSGQTLISGDFPVVNCGVKEWATTEVEEDSKATPFYIGAFLWINIATLSSYTLRFRLSFEGIAMSNVEYFRGFNG